MSLSLLIAAGACCGGAFLFLLAMALGAAAARGDEYEGPEPPEGDEA